MSDKNTPTKAETAKTAAMLWDLVLLCMGSLTIKTVWNLSLKRMFPAIPQMYFLDGVGILLIVYTIARAASVGFMSETLRTLTVALETLTEFLEGFPEVLGLKDFKFTVGKKETEESDSDLN